MSLDVQQNSVGYDDVTCDLCGLEEPTWRVIIDSAVVDYYCETCLSCVLGGVDP